MRSHKKSILTSLLVLSIAMVSAMATLRSQNQNINNQASTPKDNDEATLIQEGVVTEKQREHSKLYSRSGEKRLLDLAAERKGDVWVGQDSPPLLIESKQPSVQESLQVLGCKADVVIVGAVKSKASQLSEDGTDIFTDYEITVGDILKNNAIAPIQPSSVIIATRSGGAVKLNGHVLRAVDYSSELLRIGGRYILFLRAVPATGAYTSIYYAGDGSFQISGDKVVQVSRDLLPLGPSKSVDTATFMNEVSAVLHATCGK